MYAIINGKIISGHNIVEQQAVIINNNIIVDVLELAKLPNNITTVNANQNFIASGFIDLQLNGCGGVLFNDNISLNTINKMHQTNLAHGCTSFLPTLISANVSDIKSALEVALTAYTRMPNNVLGVHIEGPYISMVKKGIHDQQYIRTISETEVLMFEEYAAKLPIMLTLAPEENNHEYIKRLIAVGVKISIGHSNANYKEVLDIVELGVNHATHLFNAMSGFTAREPNVAGAILNNQNIEAGIIVDGLHVDFASIQIAKKLKGESLYIVTDAATSAGSNITEFKFGGQDIFVKNGRCVNKDGVLGGSNITMIESVKNASEYLSFGVTEAVRMASLYPARVMNVNNKLGLIKKGYVANLAIFNNNYKMQYVVDNGKLIEIKE